MRFREHCKGAASQLIQRPTLKKHLTLKSCPRYDHTILNVRYLDLNNVLFIFSYGDKVPRSIGGRLFGVVWINVGLVILAIYMGIVTSSLSSNSLEQVNNIYGMPVSIHAFVAWRAFS